MNRVSVAIVDFMAFLVPGVVLLLGLAVLPIPDSWKVVPLGEALIRRIPLLSNQWVAGGCWVLSAYVVGFLLRLTSIELMNILTSHRWVNRVELHSQELARAMDAAIKDEMFVTALGAIAKMANDRGVSRCATYFQFSKRFVRTRPELWIEAERLEAEVRLAAGLFVPFIVLAFAGAVRGIHDAPVALALTGFGLVGAVVVLRTFPDRRIKEVLYDQLLAIIALRGPVDKTSMPSSNPVPSEGTAPAAV